MEQMDENNTLIVNATVQGAFILKYRLLFWYSQAESSAFYLSKLKLILIVCYVQFVVHFY